MSSLVIQLQDTFHHLFVSNAFGPAGYAIYSVGVTQLPLVGILRESAGAVMLPRINQLESENGRLQILDLVARAARKLALVYFPLSAFLLVAGHEVVIFLFTRQYEASWPIFAIAVLDSADERDRARPRDARAQRTLLLPAPPPDRARGADDRPGAVRSPAGARRRDGRGVHGDLDHLAGRCVADVAAARGRADRAARVPAGRLDRRVRARGGGRHRRRAHDGDRGARVADDRGLRDGLRRGLRHRPEPVRRPGDRGGVVAVPRPAASRRRRRRDPRRAAAAAASAGAIRSGPRRHRAPRDPGPAPECGLPAPSARPGLGGFGRVSRVPAVHAANGAARRRPMGPPPADAASPRA